MTRNPIYVALESFREQEEEFRQNIREDMAMESLRLGIEKGFDSWVKRGCPMGKVN